MLREDGVIEELGGEDERLLFAQLGSSCGLANVEELKRGLEEA